MAKKPTDVSGGSIAPPSTGKTVAGQEKRHDVMEADTGHYKVEGSPVTFVQSSAQAVEALSVASSTATETGHPDVAKAAQAVQVHIQNNIFILGDGATVNQQQSFDIDQDISVTQQLAQQMEEKLTACTAQGF